MVHGDPGLREARLAEVLELLGRAAAPEDRDLLLAFAPVVFAELPTRLALGLPAAVVVTRLQAHFRFVVREMPPAHQAYGGLPGIHVRVRNPEEAEARGARGRGSAAPREHDPRDAHGRPALHLREPEELPAEAGAARLLRDPPRDQSGETLGAHRVGRRPARGRQQGELLLLPDRAGRVARAAPPHGARGLLAAQGRVRRHRRLRRHVPCLPRPGGAPAQPQRRPFRARPGAGVPGLAAGRQLRLHGHRLVSGRTRRNARPRAGVRRGRLHGPGTAARRLSRRRRADRRTRSSQPPGTGASSSWTSRTARRSTTSSRSRRSWCANGARTASSRG